MKIKKDILLISIFNPNRDFHYECVFHTFHNGQSRWENRQGINFDMVISALCEYATCQNLTSFYNLSSTAFWQAAIHTD